MYMDKYKFWLKNEYFDQQTKEELLSIKDDNKEIEDRFFRDLEFGTGGLRGIIGAGTNRMNKYTVRRATQGLSNYILRNYEQEKGRGVVIAYDTRKKSDEFAKEAALVLNGNGIKSYVFNNISSTPVLSFAVRELNCIAGLVITASHNPKEYNGYKVYWEDGGQIVPELAKQIIFEVNMINDFSQVKAADYSESINNGLYNIVPKYIDEKFLNAVREQCIYPEIIQQMGDKIKIVYTPLHGTGNIPVTEVLRQAGFKNVIMVKEQEKPDSDFSTIESPNPEDKETMTIAIETAEKHDADLALGTDPDCDRVGIVVKDDEGKYVVLSGNQTGALLVDYILSGRKKKGSLPNNGVIVKTIVTSEMGRVIADDYSIETMDTLTGFKFIGEKIKEFEENGDKEFVFGYEESYGYLSGTYTRDKDAVAASLLICEMAAFYKSKGMSLYNALIELYKKYGYYIDELMSISLKGKDGLEKMEEIMTEIRDNPPEELAGSKVVEFRDYLSSECYYPMEGNDRIKMLLPSSDVLYLKTDDNSWVCIRPSGTEPKMKIYFSAIGESMAEGYEKINRLKESIIAII